VLTRYELAEGTNRFFYLPAASLMLCDEMTENGLKYIADKYIKLGIITSLDSVDEVLETA